MITPHTIRTVALLSTLGSLAAACAFQVDDGEPIAPVVVYAEDDADDDAPPGEDATADEDADASFANDEIDDELDDGADDNVDTDPDDLADDTIDDDPADAPDDAATDDSATIAAAASSTCHPYSTRHLQASMQHTDSLAQRRTAIDRAFHNPDGVEPDTISWTEIETQGQIDRINNKAGYQTFWPSGHPTVAARNAVPISWKTSVYSFISGASFKASDGLAGVSPNRYVTRVRLRHKASGTVVVRIAHHSVSAVDHPTNHTAYRLAAHHQDMLKFNEIMKGASAPAIGSGDFNTVHLPAKLRDVNHGSQPFVFDHPATGGSHGNHLLDWVVRRKSDGGVYQLKGVRFVDLSPSDHKGVRARYSYRPGCN